MAPTFTQETQTTSIERKRIQTAAGGRSKRLEEKIN
jgi:hypothetical protein